MLYIGLFRHLHHDFVTDRPVQVNSVGVGKFSQAIPIELSGQGNPKAGWGT